MRNKILSLIIANVISVGLITACGSSASADSGGMYKSAVRADNAPMAMEESAVAYDADYGAGLGMEESAEFDDTTAESPEAPNVEENGAQSSRKLITRVNIEAETEELDPFVARIEGKAASLGGYIESSSMYTSSPYYGSGSTGRQADITARIPAKRLNEFIAELEGGSNIISRSRNVEDVTLSYVDTQAHKEALEAEKQSLLKLMNEAKSIEDIMAIETRLTDVRYELESIERQLRSYDNQIDYSTVYINLREVKVYTPQEQATVADRITKGFRESLNSVAVGCVDFAVFFITHLPQLVVFVIVVVIIVLLIRGLIGLIRKISPKKKKKSGNFGKKGRRTDVSEQGTTDSATEGVGKDSDDRTGGNELAQTSSSEEGEIQDKNEMTDNNESYERNNS